MRNLQEYLDFKNKLKAQEFISRENCGICGFASKTCYCHLVKPFDSKIVFAILIHKLEIERKIATGRMSHLCLKNSYLIPGHDYSNDDVVNSLIDNPENHCVVLYPGKGATSLNALTSVEKKSLVPTGQLLVVFVIDGTWRTARQTMRMSSNLSKLPQISFQNTVPSNFRVRKQPSDECCSTVEAIHKTIELLADSQGFDINSRVHDNLIEVFDFIVDNQISFL